MFSTRCHTNCIQAGQGFGNDSSSRARQTPTKSSKRKKAAGIESGDSKAVQRAVRLVEQQQAEGRGSGVRPVDPREAARGRVEYVKVRDWGSGEAANLGQLQLEQDSKVVELDGGSDSRQPFHETLARLLEMLQSEGSLGVAQAPGGKPLPEFQSWAFGAEHYRQYLTDLQAVHAALEGSIAGAAASLSLGAAAPGSQQERHQLQQAVALFEAKRGLDRAAALAHDLQRLAPEQQPPTSSTSGSIDAGQQLQPSPTQHAAAYAAYLASLSRQCKAAERFGELEQAVLRLLANAYMLHVTHLSSGGRVAAAAVRKLDLATRHALAFYTSYPALDARLGAGARPLASLVDSTNELGALLSGGQRDTIMQELPKAATKVAMLLQPLAREA